MADYYVGNIPVSSNYLAHYGVIGMRWGVRRTPEEMGNVTRKLNSMSDRRLNKLAGRDALKYSTAKMRHKVGKGSSEKVKRMEYDLNQRLKSSAYRKAYGKASTPAELYKSRMKQGVKGAMMAAHAFGGLFASIPVGSALMLSKTGRRSAVSLMDKLTGTKYSDFEKAYNDKYNNSGNAKYK